MTNAVEVRHLSKSIEGSPILNDICMNVRHGEVYGFLGANGAGKTSLMKTLYHIIFPDTGTVCLLGETINKGNNLVFSRIGSIIESPVFYSHLSAYENMELHCRYMSTDNEYCAPENIIKTLSMLGIAETGKKAVGKFSLGMKQRLAIAQAIMEKPSLLILDEPFNFLDPSSQAVIKHLLKRYNEEHGATVIISSHNLNHTVDVCPRIALLENGVIIRDIRNEGNSAEQELEAYFNVGVEEEAVVEETVVKAEAAVEEITEKEEKTVEEKNVEA